MTSSAGVAGAVDSLRAGLLSGVAQLGLSLSDSQIQQLLDYLALIQKWNKVYNLTAVRDSQEMLTHHLLDSLAVVAPLRRWLEGRGTAEGVQPKLLDVGAGAGLPGVVISICCPEVGVSCVDTVAKKATFIQQAALTLKLKNLAGIHARVETLQPAFDLITSRAFASLVDFTRWSANALNPGGEWMALKGKLPQAEIDALPANIDVFHVEQLAVPALDAERCLIWMRPRT